MLIYTLDNSLDNNKINKEVTGSGIARIINDCEIIIEVAYYG